MGGPPQLVEELLQLLAVCGAGGRLGEDVHVHGAAPVLVTELLVELNKELSQLDLLEYWRGEAGVPFLLTMKSL